MHPKKLPLLAALSLLFACETPKSDLLTPVAFNAVELIDSFWLPRMETQKKVLVPFALTKTEPALEGLRRTGEYLRGERPGEQFTGRTRASDLFKVMEGISYLLMLEDDPALVDKMDRMIEIIAAAQQADGYLYEPHIMGNYPNEDFVGPGRIGNRPYAFVEGSHELYNMGHLYEAAEAYYRATGKDKLLQVAEKNARHLQQVFFEGQPDYNDGKPVNQAPGHQEIELALAKLYRLTQDSLYLNLAKKLLDVRGVTYIPHGEGIRAPEYTQQHVPVRDQHTAVGHAVRAVYMYSGMADVGVLSGDGSYNQALDAIWHDIVDKKMHITGGLGAVRGIEGFGPEYVLPNKEAYCETCAAVANVFFNFRMFLLHKDAKYMDVAEISLLNNALAGVNLEGNRFFYVNPLEADGEYPFNQGNAGRSPWFNVACCPSNLARLIPQVPGLIYSYTNEDIYISYYAANRTSILLKNDTVHIAQETNYPFDETVVLRINPDTPKRFTLRLRIPGWVNQQFVPGELYSFVHPSTQSWNITINGKELEAKTEKGYAVINRKWKPGDEISLYLPMPVRYSKAHPKVEADRNKLAVSRGPLLYCAEEKDQPFPLNDLTLDQSQLGDTPYKIQPSTPLNGITSLIVPALYQKKSTGENTELTLIPYYAWNNRGNMAMKVWITF